MSDTRLTQRRCQVGVLAEACEAQRPARVIPASRRLGTLRTVQTRLVDMTDAELLLAWPEEEPQAELVTGATVDVFFDVGDEQLACRTETRGRSVHVSQSGERVAVWALAVPLFVERRQQREHTRTLLADLGPVPASFTHVAEPELKFEAELLDVSGGGLAGRVSPEVASRCRSGDVYWARFELPGASRSFQFVVRLRRVRTTSQPPGAVIGCRFCPSDDWTQYRAALREIEEFVARRERGKLALAG